MRKNSQNLIVIARLEIKTKTIQVGQKYKRVERINMGGGSVLVGGGKNGLRDLTQMALSWDFEIIFSFNLFNFGSKLVIMIILVANYF